MRKLKIALGDLSYLNGRNEFNLYVPLNIGYVAAYAKRKFWRDIDIRLFKDPKALIDYCRSEAPDVVGLSYYYWNERLNGLVAQRIRGALGEKTIIVLGGPSIDTDKAEQAKDLARFPAINALITNEGEDGFAALVESVLSGTPKLDGFPVGLSTDLANVPSPYLDGTLDEFLDGNYQPLIQTSRLCPYTCSFCTSGKNRGKLRAFPLDQVEAELDFIGKRFADRPGHRLYIVDENFGIMERDIAVAAQIMKAREKHNYPQKIFYYNDKRFTHLSRTIHETVGEMCYHGVTLSLQSDNPETLKAIKRRNLTDEHIVSAVEWAHGRGLPVSTELIFGLPMETRASFMALIDKCARLGFDHINCYNLIIFGGIEMNRSAYRSEHGLKTARRLMDGCDQIIDGDLVVEHEEVVTSSKSFSFEDYKFVRKMNVLLHAIFIEGMHRDYFKALVAKGNSLSAFIEAFLNQTGGNDLAAVAHREFLRQMETEIERELYTDEQITELVRSVQVGTAQLPKDIKLQKIFARRLIEASDGWVAAVLPRISAVHAKAA